MRRLRTALPLTLWLLTALAMLRDWYRDPYDPSRVGTRRYGHNAPDSLRTGLIAIAIELFVVLVLLRPWNPARFGLRTALVAALLVPWTMISMMFSMHQGGIFALHFVWLAALVLLLVGLGIASAVSRTPQG